MYNKKIKFFIVIISFFLLNFCMLLGSKHSVNIWGFFSKNKNNQVVKSQPQIKTVTKLPTHLKEKKVIGKPKHARKNLRLAKFKRFRKSSSNVEKSITVAKVDSSNEQIKKQIEEVPKVLPSTNKQLVTNTQASNKIIDDSKNFLASQIEKIKNKLKSIKNVKKQYQLNRQLMEKLNEQYTVANFGFKNLENQIKNKFEEIIDQINNKLGNIEQKIETIEKVASGENTSTNRLESLEKNIINQMGMQLNAIENKLVTADQMAKEKLALAKKVEEKSRNVGKLARLSIDDEIKTEVNRQLAELKEERLRTFEKTMKKRKKEKRVQRLKTMLQEALFNNNNNNQG